MTPIYHLDYASKIVVDCIPFKGNEYVLDLCAAPGGKSLMAFTKIPQGKLVANEKSSDRRGRLKKVMDEYIPKNERERIQITAHDAKTWCLFEAEKNKYDVVMLDAPCSSERHVLLSESHLKEWRLKRSKQLALDQFTMLAGAIELTKIGGFVMYSTCAISPLENDDVIKKLIQKRSERIRIVDINHHDIEKTLHGCQILPDRDGHGPIYFSLIERIA
jgi:16S rRNA C967 or C1407 C5-methylase (RsmB/RsmF family)